MAGVPFVFGNATTSIPLSNLDANFNTGVTIGNTTVGLGNTVTTLGNVTLTNATIVANTSSIAANAVVYTNSSGNLTGNTSIFTVDTSGNVAIGSATSTIGKLTSWAAVGTNGLAIIPLTQTANANTSTLLLSGDGLSNPASRGCKISNLNGSGSDVNNLSLATGYAGTITEWMRITNYGSAYLSNSRFTPATNLSNLPITNIYNEEKLYQVATSASSYNICTITSAYTYGTLIVEVTGTIQYAGADQRTASNRKSIIQFKNGSITAADIYTAYNGSFGTITFTYVSDGVVQVSSTGMTTAVGQGNGIAWIKVVGGNNSTVGTSTPLAFTLS